MKVVILCGGFGTRIRDVADDVPKPMIPVGGLPILWHIMKYFAHFGHTEFILCLGYKGGIIKDFFLNYQAMTSDFTITLGEHGVVQYHGDHDESGWRVTLVDTGLNAMTGARVKRVQKYLKGDDNFLLTYGDGVGNVNIDRLLDFHAKHRRILTVTGVRPPGRFGEIVGANDGVVTEFNEKPQAAGGRISGGFFVCRTKLFDYLDDREDLIFEVDPMRRLVLEHQLMVYEHDEFWQPMDTYRDYALLNSLYENGSAPWKVWS